MYVSDTVGNKKTTQVIILIVGWGLHIRSVNGTLWNNENKCMEILVKCDGPEIMI